MLDRKCYTSLQIDFYFKDFCLKLELQSLYFFFLNGKKTSQPPYPYMFHIFREVARADNRYPILLVRITV